MKMSKEATRIRREIINNYMHSDFYKSRKDVDIYKTLSEILRISPSSVREIHKKYCNNSELHK